MLLRRFDDGGRLPPEKRIGLKFIPNRAWNSSLIGLPCTLNVLNSMVQLLVLGLNRVGKCQIALCIFVGTINFGEDLNSFVFGDRRTTS